MIIRLKMATSMALKIIIRLKMSTDRGIKENPLNKNKTTKSAKSAKKCEKREKCEKNEKYENSTIIVEMMIIGKERKVRK